MKAAPGLLHRGKRWLYLIHRWIGIVTCLLLAMWFLSGVVMMYVPFPSLTQKERLAGLAPIDWTKVHGAPQPDSWLQEGPDGPIWLGDTTVSASTGHTAAPVSADRASLIAGEFAKDRVQTVEQVERDQWTVSGSFDRYRPLWKVALDRPDGLVLYVSSATGTVVLDTNRTERLWNWVGSVPHWIYPTVLRQDQPLWRQVILWTSGAGIVVTASGMWIGVLRMRLRRRYKGGRISPYRSWQWWHHVTGLFGGTMLLLWIVSGWLSVDPNRWFASKGIDDPSRAAYAAAGAPPVIDWRQLGGMAHALGARRMRLVWTDGTPLLLLTDKAGEEILLDARTLKPSAINPDRLLRAARRLLPGAAVTGTAWLTEADAYWYEAKGKVELPVLRIRFADPAKTWVTISPRTGEVLSDIDARGRLYRWLFDGLHRWDFNGLITRRPLWDVWMWFWLLSGAAVSTSAVVIAFRRLKMSAGKNRCGPS